jgi:hypothetical protein
MSLFSKLAQLGKMFTLKDVPDLIPVPEENLFYRNLDIPDGPGLDTLNWIIEQLPPLDMRKGPWIAGGAVRRILEGKSLEGGDVDIFFASSAQYKRFKHCLSGFEKVIETRRATTFLVQGIQVQVICRQFYLTVEDLFKDFDFSVCQIATDGKKIAVSNQGYNDIRSKSLRFAPGGKVARQTVIKRMNKYLAHGFIPEPGLYETMVQSGLTCVSSYSIFEGSEREFSSNYEIEEGKEEPQINVEDMSAEILREAAQRLGIEIPHE